ncbi:hypothetical protein JW905_17530 [bacterium]|nr:hypothetical protein [candidate division CSSED10-310 bacterium]
MHLAGTDRASRPVGAWLWIMALVFQAVLPARSVRAESIDDAAAHLARTYVGLSLYGYDGDLSGLLMGDQRTLELIWLARRPIDLDAAGCLVLLDRRHDLVVPLAPPFQLRMHHAAEGAVTRQPLTLQLPRRVGNGSFDLAVRVVEKGLDPCAAETADQFWRTLRQIDLRPAPFLSELPDEEVTEHFGGDWRRMHQGVSLGPAGTVEMPLPSPGSVTQLLVISTLRFGRLLTQGTKIAEITVRGVGGEVATLGVKAGIDVSEGYSEQANYPPKHARSLVYQVTPAGIPLFYCIKSLDLHGAVTSLTLTYTHDEGCWIVEDLLFK